MASTVNPAWEPEQKNISLITNDEQATEETDITEPKEETLPGYEEEEEGNLDYDDVLEENMEDDELEETAEDRDADNTMNTEEDNATFPLK